MHLDSQQPRATKHHQGVSNAQTKGGARIWYQYQIFLLHQQAHLVFDLVLLGVLERDVVLGQPRLPLPVLQQDEPDLHRRSRTNQGEEQERIEDSNGAIGCGLATMAEDNGDAWELRRAGAWFGSEGRNEYEFSFLCSSGSRFCCILSLKSLSY